MVLKVKSTRYIVVSKFDQVKKLVAYCKATRYASLDFETFAGGPHGYTISDDGLPTGPQYEEDQPSVLGISFQPYSSWVIPLFHFQSPFSKSEALLIIKYLARNILEDRNIVKVAYNLKFEARWFLRYGYRFKGTCLDVMGMKYLLNEERPNDLKSLVAAKIPKYAGYEDEVRDTIRKYGGWHKVPMNILAPYNAMDTDVTLRLVSLLEKKLIKFGFYKLFRSMFMMQTRVLAESESMGLCVDVPYLKKIIVETDATIKKKHKSLMAHKRIVGFQQWRVDNHVRKLIKECKEEIEKIESGELEYAKPEQAIRNREEKISRYIAGTLVTKKEKLEYFNPASVPQMIDFLYKSKAGLRLPILKYTKDKKTKKETTNPSTDEETLLKLKRKDKSGFIGTLLEYREITKLYSTYMVAIDYRLTKQNRVHGSFLIHGTVTGRLSSKNPNLQNIPRDTTSSLIKTMYVPPPGHLLFEVDYGQAELRVAAELAQDEAMLDIFKRNYNIHVATAAKLNHKYDEYNQIKGILGDPKHKDNLFWEKQKKKGKVLNFSILFGQSDFETAQQMDCSVDEAREFKAEWFRQFPGIKKLMKKVERFVEEHGYVKSMFGRKRRLPDIYSPSSGHRNKALRDAINAPIQGASSDYTQLSTIEIRERTLMGDLIMTDNLDFLPQAYTVHDSIGFYIMPKYIHTAVPKVLDIMANTPTLKYFDFEMKRVKMKASPEIGITWGGLQEYNPWTNYEKLLNP